MSVLLKGIWAEKGVGRSRKLSNGFVFYKSPERDFTLVHGDCVETLESFDFQFDAVFADPPYFLSNGGFSIQSGRVVSVDKGKWDKSRGHEADLAFTRRWIAACRKKLTPAGTIWICGTFHNIFTIGQVLEEQGFRILNAVTWQKTNPPPNLSCRFFTYSAETLIWARREKKVPHCFNYDLMRAINGHRQMPDVWLLPAIARWEKAFGKHPTQKPLSVVTRAILASTKEHDWVLDPFSGSGTTGIAANLTGRRYLGIDTEESFLNISIQRRKAIENPEAAEECRRKIPDTRLLAEQNLVREPAERYGRRELPF